MVNTVFGMDTTGEHTKEKDVGKEVDGNVGSEVVGYAVGERVVG